MLCVLASVILTTTTPSAAQSNVILRTAAEINDFYAQKYSGEAFFEIEGSVRPDGDTYIFDNVAKSVMGFW